MAQQASLTTMGNILVTDVQVPPQKPFVGSLPKPRQPKRNSNVVQGYNQFYHSAAPFHSGEVKHSLETIKVFTLETKDEQSRINAIGQMGIDFHLALSFTVKENGDIDVLVAFPEHPSSLMDMMRFDTYARNLIHQVVRGTLFRTR